MWTNCIRNFVLLLICRWSGLLRQVSFRKRPPPTHIQKERERDTHTHTYVPIDSHDVEVIIKISNSICQYLLSHTRVYTREHTHAHVHPSVYLKCYIPSGRQPAVLYMLPIITCLLVVITTCNLSIQ